MSAFPSEAAGAPPSPPRAAPRAKFAWRWIVVVALVFALPGVSWFLPARGPQMDRSYARHVLEGIRGSVRYYVAAMAQGQISAPPQLNEPGGSARKLLAAAMSEGYVSARDLRGFLVATPIDPAESDGMPLLVQASPCPALRAGDIEDHATETPAAEDMPAVRFMLMPDLRTAEMLETEYQRDIAPRIRLLLPGELNK